MATPDLDDILSTFLLNQRFANTREAYGSDLAAFFDFTGKRSIAQLTKLDLVTYREHLESAGYEPATVARKLAALKSFLRFCVEEEWVERNPALGLRLPAVSKEGKTPEFSDDEVQRLLSIPDLRTPKGVRDRLILELLFHLGLRASELTGLTFGDIEEDRSQKILRVKGKGGKERRVPLQPRLMEWIARYESLAINFNAEPETPLFRPFRNPIDGNLNRKISTRSVWVLIKQLAKKAGISKPVTTHSGRVTATGNALDHDAGIIEITELMGWSTVQMVQRYDRRRKKLINQAAFKISYDEASQE